MAKTVLDKYLETQNARQLSPEELVANFRKEIDDYSFRTPTYVNGSTINNIRNLSDQIYGVYSRMPEIDNEEKAQYRYLADTLIAQAYGVDVTDVMANSKKYRTLVFGDSNIDDKTFFKAAADSWNSVKINDKIANLNIQYMFTKDEKERAKLSGDIRDAERELVRLGDYNEDRSWIGQQGIKAAPLVKQIGTTAVLTYLTAGLGGIAGGLFSGGASAAVQSATKLNSLKSLIGVGTKAFRTGARLGMITDGVINTFVPTFGLTINELRNTVDDDGNELDESTILIASLLNGIVSTAFEYATPDPFAGSIITGNTMSKTLRSMSIKSAKDFLSKKGLAALGTDILHSAFNESLEEALQGAASSLTSDVVKMISDKKGDTDFGVRGSDAAINMLQEGVGSFFETIWPMLLVGGASTITKTALTTFTSRTQTQSAENTFKGEDGDFTIPVEVAPVSTNENVSKESLAKYAQRVVNKQETQSETENEAPRSTATIKHEESQNILNPYENGIVESSEDGNVQENLPSGEAIDSDDIVEIEEAETDPSKLHFTQDGVEYQLKDKLPSIKLNEVGNDALTFADSEAADIKRMADKVGATAVKVKIEERKAKNEFDTSKYSTVSNVDEADRTIHVNTLNDADVLYNDMKRSGFIVTPYLKRDRKTDGSYQINVTRNGVNETWNIVSDNTLGSDKASRRGNKLTQFTNQQRTKASSYIISSLYSDKDRQKLNTTKDIKRLEKALKPSADALLIYAEATGNDLDSIINNKTISFRIITDESYEQMKTELGNAFGGYTRKRSQDSVTIYLTKDANPETIIHEIGHAVRLSLSPRELADFTKHYGKFGATWLSDVPSNKSKDGKYHFGGVAYDTREEIIEIARKNEERFADDFVTYVATQKAPTSVLKSVFEKMKKFLGGLLSSNRKALDESLIKKFERLFEKNGALDKYYEQFDNSAEATTNLFQTINEEDMYASGERTAEEEATGTGRANSSLRYDNIGLQLNYKEILSLYDQGCFVTRDTIARALRKENIPERDKARLKSVLNRTERIISLGFVDMAKRAKTLNEFQTQVKAFYDDRKLPFGEKTIADINTAWQWSKLPTPQQMQEQFLNRFANKRGILDFIYSCLNYDSVYEDKNGNVVVRRVKLNNEHITEMLRGINRNSPNWEFNRIINDMCSNTKVWMRAYNLVYKNTLALKDGKVQRDTIPGLYIDYLTSYNSNYYWTTSSMAGEAYNDLFGTFLADFEPEDETLSDLEKEIDSLRRKAENTPELSDEEAESINNRYYNYNEMADAEKTKHQEQMKLLESEIKKDIDDYIKDVREKAKKAQKAKDKEYYWNLIKIRTEELNRKWSDRLSQELKNANDKHKQRVDKLLSDFDKQLKKEREFGEEAVRRAVNHIRGIATEMLQIQEEKYQARLDRIKEAFKEKELVTRVESRLSRELAEPYDPNTLDSAFLPYIQLISLIKGSKVESINSMFKNKDENSKLTGYAVVSPDGKSVYLGDENSIRSPETWNRIELTVVALAAKGKITNEEAQEFIRRLRSDKIVERKYINKKNPERYLPENDYRTWNGKNKYILYLALREIKADARRALKQKKDAKKTELSDIETRMANAVAPDAEEALSMARTAVYEREYEKYEKSFKDSDPDMTYDEYVEEFADILEPKAQAEFTNNTSKYLLEVNNKQKENKAKRFFGKLTRYIIHPSNLAQMLDGAVDPENGLNEGGVFYDEFVRKPWEMNQSFQKNVDARIEKLNDKAEEILGYELKYHMDKDKLGRLIDVHFANGQGKADTSIPNFTAKNALGVYVNHYSSMSHLIDIAGCNIKEADVRRIIETDEILTAEEKAFGDYLIHELDENWTRVADVAYSSENKILLHIDNYFPRVSSNYTVVELNNDTASNPDRLNTIWDGFTDQRKGAIYELNLNPLSVYIDAVNAQEQYIAFNQWARDIRQILDKDSSSKARGVGSLIATYVGESERDALRTYYNRVTGKKQSLEDYEKFYNRILGNINAGRIALSIPSFLRQFIGLSTAKLAIGKDIHLGRALFSVLSNYQELGQIINDKDATMKHRSYDLFMNQFENDPEFASLSVKKQEIARRLMKFSEFGDNLVARTVWLAVYDSEIQKGSSESDAVFKASQAVSTTQSSTDRLTLSELQSTKNPAIKTMLSFTNDLFQVWNILFFNSDLEWRAYKKAKMLKSDVDARKHFNATISKALIPVVSSVFSAIIAAGWIGEDDDDEGMFSLKDFMEDFLVESAAAFVPIAGPAVLQDFIRGFSYDSYLLQSLNDAKSFSNSIWDFIGGGLDTRTLGKILDDGITLTTDALGLFGFPSNAIKRLYNVIADIEDDELNFELNFGNIYNSKLGTVFDSKGWTIDL